MKSSLLVVVTGRVNRVQTPTQTLASPPQHVSLVVQTLPTATHELDATGDGAVVGRFVGEIEGIDEGDLDGIKDGTHEGANDGTGDGFTDGANVGRFDGTSDGDPEGGIDGVSDEEDVGGADGVAEGTLDGATEGVPDEVSDGTELGTEAWDYDPISFLGAISVMNRQAVQHHEGVWFHPTRRRQQPRVGPLQIFVGKCIYLYSTSNTKRYFL